MKIEPGRFYSTADGRRLGPAVLEGDRRGIEGRWSMNGNDYDDDGHATSGPDGVNDAVEVWLTRTTFNGPPADNPGFDPAYQEPREFTKAPSVEDLTSFGHPRQGEAIMDDQTARTVEEQAREYIPYQDAGISWVPTLNLRYATSFDRRHVLQQQWVEAGGRTEWRDVPRVTI